MLLPSDPQQVGSYRLLGRLGSGGMGQVFLGESPGGRLVAVKLIRPELADSPEFRHRFTREVAAARQVSGIFTVPVVDADTEAPQPWLVTGYVDGPSLQSLVADHGAMAEGDVVNLGRALAEGLSAIHAAGIVHRDLKPANVLLASDGPRIIDFGISRAAETTSLTQTGLVVGSPGFMSPEQANGRQVTTATDVFSLGAVLAFAATGSEPFGSGAASTLLFRVVHSEPALTDVPGELRTVLEGCLRKDPVERPNPEALLGMLASLSNEQPTMTAAVVGRTSTALSSAGDLSWETAVSRMEQPGDTGRAPAASLKFNSVSTRELTRRRRRWPWIVLAALFAVAVGGGVAFAFHGSGAHTPPRAESPGTAGTSTSPSAAGKLSPTAVVKAYFAAINAHDWHKVWQLGGKNLSPSYRSMVDGFQLTSRDKITRTTVAGDVVTVRFRAYETTGQFQIYLNTYTVRGGIIASGSKTLVS